MSISDVQICNKALVKVGADPISSLSLDTKAARFCNAIFEITKNEVLQAHPWKFATRRVELALAVETPEFGFDYKFRLPNDCLQVHDDPEYNDNEHKIEGRFLLTDETEFSIRYTTSSVEPADYTPLFAEALACRLASDLAYGLKESTSLKDAMFKEYLVKLNTARSRDSQQGTPPHPVLDGWNRARL